MQDRKPDFLIVGLSALGASLLLFALTLWAKTWLAERISAEEKRHYLSYQRVPDPTLIPPTPTPIPTPTISPTPTATPTPTPPPQPQPPTRLIIPSLGINSSIRPISLEVSGDPLDPDVSWPELGSGVAHDSTSVNPGETGNCVLVGHNNYAGQVFRRLNEIEVGDRIYVYTLDHEFSYEVDKIDIVQAVAATELDKQSHAFYLGRKAEETLTLVSCWPYTTYTHRIYVVARPLATIEQ
jgi:LPXTG-site transpeptidase (sortase) family protein